MSKSAFLKVLFLMVILGFQSCNVKKFIPEDKLLYTGAEIDLISEDEIVNRDNILAELETLLEPEPNSKILGTRWGLYFYYKAQRENPGFINKFLNKKFGEEPVYLSDADPFETEELLKNRMENRGYFYSRVDHSIERNEAAKEAKILYDVLVPEEPYVLETYQIDNDSIQIFRDIKQTLEQTVLEPGMPFDLSALKVERERIDFQLKSQGYYNFSSNFLLFEADTNQYDRKKFDLFLTIKEEVPPAGLKPYVVAEVNVYPNYAIGTDSIEREVVRYGDRNYIQNEIFFKPEKLDPFILIDEGEFYSPAQSALTSRRLTSLGTYKFVNVRYDVLDSLSTDSLGYLEANIFLSPLTKRTLRAELQAVTKSNSFAGPHLALSYTDRNLWDGGEIFNATAAVGYERQLTGGSQPGLSSTQFSLDTDLIFPRMIFPIDINDNWFEYSIPKTVVGAGFEYLNRTQLFSLFTVTADFGYIWKANRFITHNLKPLSVNYLQLSNTTREFEEVLRNNPFLQRSFDQQFIAGLTYSFLYNEMIDVGEIHQLFLNANLELAGNTLDLLSNGETPKKFLGLEFAQFVKVDADFRYHYNLTAEQTIATRLFAGIGIPYGNSEIMPFSRQFFAGGPYSVRAFQIRRLGPGEYRPETVDNVTFYDQMGNIRLEANVEYRFPIYQFFKGAFFVDAGNVWNSKEYNLPQGEFESDFLSEFGIGVGTGLRIDIQSFVIRFDVGVPVHTPWLEEGERWDFRIKDPVLNFGIGYPF